MNRRTSFCRPGGPVVNSPGRQAGKSVYHTRANVRRTGTGRSECRSSGPLHGCTLGVNPRPDGRGYFLSALRAYSFAAGLLLLLSFDDLQAQPRGRPAPAAAAPPATTRPADVEEDAAKDPSENLFPGGAALKTDPEQQRLLKRAEQCVEDGRLDLAAVLWQKVLDEAGDTLMLQYSKGPPESPVPVAIYTSLAEQVERTLAKLPPLALATYRTSADGEAQALLSAAGETGEEEALAAVVRRFFLSSHGDDAAFKLACLALDRHDFVGASRLLNKILERYPDPSIPRSEILLRLAVASARMGDKQTAQQSLDKLPSVTGPRPPSDVVDLIAADVRSSAQATASVAAAARDWHLAHGNPSRTGFMVGLPPAATSRTLSELWVREDPLAMSAPPGHPRNGVVVFMGGVDVMGGRVLGGRGMDPNQNQTPVSREELITNWRSGGWTPTGRLLFSGGRVYLKTPDRLVCYQTSAHNQDPVWQSAWENRYELDTKSLMQAQLAMAYGLQQQQSNRPKTPAEVLLFGDRVHQSFTIDGGAIYSIEGKRAGAETVRPNPAMMRGFQHGVVARRTRGNWLSAYQTSGGKALWTRPASDEDKEGSTDVGFLSAPVPCGTILLAPITDGGTIWLLGLERATGKTLWRSYLCDEPQGGASPWAEVVMAVDGREAYLTCGCGVVFAVDAVGGTVRWAVRYQRDGKPNQMMRNYGIQQTQLDLSGWDDDLVIPHGKDLIVMSSDSDQILGLDRRTGEFVWNSPRVSSFGSVASYCLGVQGRYLFAAGKNVVRCYDLVAQGKVHWEREIKDDSFGRGCITEDALYVPVKDSILKLDPHTGRELGQVGVALTSDEPVGNLFSDGDKLWAVGAGRVYAMTTLEHRMQILADQIAAGDGEAQLNRMRLYFKQNRPELALADLRAAYVLFQSRQSPDEAAQRLFAAMNELKMPQREPLVALQLLTDLFVSAPSVPQLTKEGLGRRADIVASTVSVLRQQKPAGALAMLLEAAPLFTEDYLLSAATFAVDATASKDDVAALIGAIESGAPEAKLLTIRAASRLAPDDAKAPLAKLLPEGDDRVRLAAARALANLGEREDVLETFVALLESPELRIRSRSQQGLKGLTGQSINFPPDGKPEDRATAVAQWKQWLAASGATAKLTLPLLDQAVPLGRTLLVSQGQSLVVELDADNKVRWRQTLPGPAWGCQGLSNGHRLIAIYSHSMVIEYDDNGKEVWRKDRLPGAPYTVQRLENGNTLVACADANQLVEIASDGTTKAINIAGRPISAQRLDNGNTLVALQQGNRVVEVDSAGKITWEARTTGPPSHAVRLDNGNTLVTVMSPRQVVEFDPTGKTIAWKSAVALTNPYVAQRLPSGNTLVADHRGVHELDASGQRIIRSHTQPQVTGLSSY